MQEALAEILRKTPAIWRGRSASAAARIEPTGFSVVDGLLPASGWPVGAMTELVPLGEGFGELSLLLPALARLTARGRQIVLIRPPYLPYAPALRSAGVSLDHLSWIEPGSDDDARWSAEQTLREKAAGAVVLWTPTEKDLALRRLQVAAEDSGSLLFVYRPYSALRQGSPAALRLALHPALGGLKLEVIKARGGHSGRVAHCPLRTAA